MDIKWMEDFLCLAESRSFSRAAAERHITQPAFSRRIQSLESWLGAELLDRSCYPPTLTPAGHLFRNFAADLLRQLYDARGMLRGQQAFASEAIRFAVPHTLSITFFPKWFRLLTDEFGPISASVQATNVLEGITALVEREADFLVCYHHPQLPMTLDPDRYPFISLGVEQFRPYSATDAAGEPIFRLPGNSREPVPLLRYAPGTFFGHVVEMILLKARQTPHMKSCFETHMAESLKYMALAGHGLGWLPDSCVEQEVEAGRLALASDGQWGTRLEIRLYRSWENRNPVVDRLWSFLMNHGGFRAAADSSAA